MDSPRLLRAIDRLRRCVSEGFSGEFIANLRRGRIKHLWVDELDLLEDVPDNGKEGHAAEPPEGGGQGAK